MLRTPALAAGLLLHLSTSWAAAPPPPVVADGPRTVWLCGLSSDATQLVCMADPDGAAEAIAPTRVEAVVNGTRFPLDPRQRWTVDLWSPFSGESGWLEVLARATICYRSPGCEVILHEGFAIKSPTLASRPVRSGR